MKIVATVTDCSAVAYLGGEVSKKSCIIELPEPLPELIKKYLKNKEWASQQESRYTYETLSFSVLDEE